MDALGFSLGIGFVAITSISKSHLMLRGTVNLFLSLITIMCLLSDAGSSNGYVRFAALVAVCVSTWACLERLDVTEQQ